MVQTTILDIHLCYLFKEIEPSFSLHPSQQKFLFKDRKSKVVKTRSFKDNIVLSSIFNDFYENHTVHFLILCNHSHKKIIMHQTGAILCASPDTTVMVKIQMLTKTL